MRMVPVPMRKWGTGWGIALGLLSLVLLVLWLLFMVASNFIIGDEGKPIPHTLSNLPSPDGRWVATLEQVDNGLGFGLGMVYYEIHVHRPDQPIVDHGDPDRTVVFYVEALGREPRVAWREGTNLFVEYDAQDEHGGPAALGRHRAHYGAVTITYQLLPALPLKPAARAAGS
jgi:hypothetical protein